MAEGILRDTIDEVKKRIACLLFVADMDIPEIEEHLNHTQQVVVNVDHINKAQNLDLQTWRAQVKDLVNDLSDLVDDQLRRWSSGTWKKLIFRFYTQYQTLSKIKELARKLYVLSEYYQKNLTHFEAAADRETDLTDLYEGYNLLTFHQKQCFAYCSLFPKDYQFDVSQLINLWLAEEFLSNIGSWEHELPEPEDLGQKYVRAFMEMGIFQDVEVDEIGRIRTCKLTPQMHDLATFVAGHGSIIMDRDEDSVCAGLRRVSFDYSLDILSGIPDTLFRKAKKLRTILLPAIIQSRPPNEVKMSNSTCEEIISSFKCLRVLDLHNLGIKVLPASIGYLKHLQYLDLSDNDMEKLPSSISRLTNLQTLKLSHCHMLKELPKDLKQLKSLRHLEIKGCLDLTHMPAGMKQMVSLRTLSHFVVGNSPNGGGLEELAGLNQLTEVEILHLERLKLTALDNDEPDDGSYLEDNTSLECLTLRWDHDTSDDEAPSELQLRRLRPHEELKVLCIVGYLGKEFQSWLSSFNYLAKFSLYNCPSCEYIPPLHTLPNLKILKLQRLDSLQYIDQDSHSTEGLIQDSHSTEGLISFPGDFFESLMELSLWDCPKLTSWWIETNIKAKFPCISTIEVRYCPQLTCMPLFSRLDKLVLVSSSVKPLEMTLNDETTTLPPLSKLKFLVISNVMIESLPLEHCNHLVSLTIESCAKLDLPDDAWMGLKSLCRLTIREIPKLKSFPSYLRDLTSLEDLELHSCRELKFLPDDIGKLASLRKLVISQCDKLASLPEKLSELERLETLIIRDCPSLLPRCQPEIGDDLPKIAHIKKITLMQTYQDLWNS